MENKKCDGSKKKLKIKKQAKDKKKLQIKIKK